MYVQLFSRFWVRWSVLVLSAHFRHAHLIGMWLLFNIKPVHQTNQSTTAACFFFSSHTQPPATPPPYPSLPTPSTAPQAYCYPCPTLSCLPHIHTHPYALHPFSISVAKLGAKASRAYSHSSNLIYVQSVMPLPFIILLRGGRDNAEANFMDSREREGESERENARKRERKMPIW